VNDVGKGALALDHEKKILERSYGVLKASGKNGWVSHPYFCGCLGSR